MYRGISKIAISAFLIGTAVTIVMVQSQISIALSSAEISQMAKKFTVQIDENINRKGGSGVIIGRKSEIYIVLTNFHVVKENLEPSHYTVRTFDKKFHNVKMIKELKGADLAVIEFTSSNRYTVVKDGNSDQLVEGQKIYFSGYPGEQSLARKRGYRFYGDESIVGFLSESDITNGYQISFTGAALKGMSGSPILDENGELIGIYGKSEVEEKTGQISLYGIPINTAKRLLEKMDIELESPCNQNNFVTCTKPRNHSGQEEQIIDLSSSPEEPEPPKITCQRFLFPCPE